MYWNWLSWIGETSEEPPLDIQVIDERDSLQDPWEPSMLASGPCSPTHQPDLLYTFIEHHPCAEHSPFRPLGTLAESRSWQLCQEVPSEAPSTSVSPPTASQTTARSLWCGFISQLRQLTYSWETLITVTASEACPCSLGYLVPVTSKSTG